MYKAAIFGIKSHTLSVEEREFFQKEKPLGFILFSRNIDSKLQLQNLITQLRSSVENPNAPIFIDQEGGRVKRLRAPTWYSPPPAAIFGKIAKHDIKDAEQACALNTQIIAQDLQEMGINVNCSPVVDLPVKGANDVIGDRAFSHDKEITTLLAQTVIDNFSAENITPIIKHIPGHGRAKADSHLKLPIVNTDLKTLCDTDFYPFKNIRNINLAMTAHVVYSAIDPLNPATHSPDVINEIRSTIGFNGLIVSDCLTMKALSGTIEEKTDRAFKAGCNLIIYSLGDIKEMSRILEYTPTIAETEVNFIHKTCKPAKSQSYQEKLASLRYIMKKHHISMDGKFISDDPTENSFNS